MPCADRTTQHRLLRYHLSGCPADQYWSPPPPGTPPGPACAPASVNKEYCADTCNKWRPWPGGASSFYVAVGSGVGVPNAVPHYGECACDDALQFGGLPALPAALPDTACPAKCLGNPTDSPDRCGGAPGDFTINVYHVDCSGWGWTLYCSSPQGSVATSGLGLR